MQINGKWLLCDDGEIRPVIEGLVRQADGQWLEAPFLLDAGADRTVFSPDLLEHLHALEVIDFDGGSLAGVGGQVKTITIETEIGFIRDNGRPVQVRGTFCVFTESGSTDMSVLGRDVTNNFSVIYDYPNHVVALLAPPHSYNINAPA